MSDPRGVGAGLWAVPKGGGGVTSGTRGVCPCSRDHGAVLDRNSQGNSLGRSRLVQMSGKKTPIPLGPHRTLGIGLR